MRFSSRSGTTSATSPSAASPTASSSSSRSSGGHLLGAAGALRDRPRELERHPGSGQVAERVRHRPAAAGERWTAAARQQRPVESDLHLVVVGDDQFQTELARDLRLRDAGDAAIDADDERHATLAPVRGACSRVQPVALGEP